MSGISSRSSLLGISGAFIGICSIAVALRFYARKKQSQRLQSDDWAMLGALLSFYVFAGVCIGSVHLGTIGWGEIPFPPSDYKRVFTINERLLITSDVSAALCFALTKISALMLYKRIFCVSSNCNRLLYWLVVGTSVVVACWAVTFSFIGGFQCGSDLTDDWIAANRTKDCSKYGNIFAYGILTSDLILDVWVITLPIPNIVSLRMSLKKKLTIVGVFMLALVGVVASIVRFAEFLQIAVLKTKESPVTHEEDFNSRVFFFNTLEMGMMIVSINIPVIGALFTNAAPELLLKWARSVTSLASRVGSNHSVHSSSDASGAKKLESGEVAMTKLTPHQHAYQVDVSGNGGERHSLSTLPARIQVESSFEVSSVPKEGV